MARKQKTPEQKLRDNNARLLRTYGITQDEYDFMLAEQNGGCKICGSTPKKRRLHVDHCHRIVKTKITATKVSTGKKSDYYWYAIAEVSPLWDLKSQNYRKKSEAVREMRVNLKRISVRGILCFPCNKVIRLFYDNPDRMESAAKYIREYQSRTAA